MFTIVVFLKHRKRKQINLMNVSIDQKMKSQKELQMKMRWILFHCWKSMEKFLGAEVSQSENIVTLRQPLLIEHIITAI